MFYPANNSFFNDQILYHTPHCFNHLDFHMATVGRSTPIPPVAWGSLYYRWCHPRPQSGGGTRVTPATAAALSRYRRAGSSRPETTSAICKITTHCATKKKYVWIRIRESWATLKIRVLCMFLLQVADRKLVPGVHRGKHIRTTAYELR